MGQAERGVVAVTYAVFRQIVGVVDDADAECAAVHGCGARCCNRIVLIIQQGIKCAYGQIGKLFQFVQVVQCAQVEGGQGAQGDFAVRVVDVVQRFGRQGDFHAQVGLMNRRNAWIKRTVRVAVVNVLDVDTTGTGAFLHQGGEQFCCRQSTFADVWILFVLSVEALEFVLVGEEGIIQTRNFIR